jgi:hypothetical protein
MRPVCDFLNVPVELWDDQWVMNRKVIWKQPLPACCDVLSAEIFLEALGKITKNRTQDSHAPTEIRTEYFRINL